MMKLTSNKIFSFMLAAAFALTLAGCGGGGGSTTQTPTDMPDPQAACEADGGEYRDGTCVTAAELMAERMAAQRADIKAKLDAAQTAVGAVDNDSDAAEVSAADAAIAAAKAAIAAAEDVPAAEKTANTGTVTALEAQLADAKTARMAAMDDDQKAADAAMMADARKLHAGITSQVGTAGTLAADDRWAQYNTAETAIEVSVAGDTALDAAIVLSEDKKTTVADNHGWAGKRYADPDGGDMYEAMVYSNVGDPTEGDPFNEEYTLTDGALAIDTSAAATPGSRVASPRFDQSAGLKRFKLPSPNPSGATRITVPGSFHGVSGTYTCTPGDGNTCVSRIAENGFDLGVVADADGAFTAGSWSFKPTSATAKVTSATDMEYASYGWWIKKSADGKTFTASAFVDERGTVAAAADITALRGTATYMGGAAGKYALYSATGGTNDAGHFTARATLEADFNADMITGTIDQFMGADGMSRDWSVELKKSTVGDTGIINSTGLADAAGNETVWTIDGTAAAAAGAWSGTLRDNGDDGVAKVGTGTFYSEFSTSGKMVGAFGVNKQ